MADDQTISEGSAVVGALTTHRENLLAISGEDHSLSIGMAANHSTIGNALYRNSLLQIRSCRGRLFSAHSFSPVRWCVW
jgi:hypothetical protein